MFITCWVKPYYTWILNIILCVTLMNIASDLVNLRKTHGFWASSYLNVGVLPIYISFGKIREVLQVQQKSSRSVSLQAAPCPVILNPGLRRWNMRHSGLSVTRPQLNGGAAFCIDIILHKTITETTEKLDQLVFASTFQKTIFPFKRFYHANYICKMHFIVFI